MNREKAKALLPIITAFVEGKTIQYDCLGSGAWDDVLNPDFTRDASRYRVKPEPRVIWAIYNRFDERIYTDNSEDRVKKEFDRLNRDGSNAPYTMAEFVEQL